MQFIFNHVRRSCSNHISNWIELLHFLLSCMDASGTGIIIESDYSNSYRKLKLSTANLCMKFQLKSWWKSFYSRYITSGKIRVPKSFNDVLYLVNWCYYKINNYVKHIKPLLSISQDELRTCAGAVRQKIKLHRSKGNASQNVSV